MEAGERMSDHPLVLNFVLSLYEQLAGDLAAMPTSLSQLYSVATAVNLSRALKPWDGPTTRNRGCHVAQRTPRLTVWR